MSEALLTLPHAFPNQPHHLRPHRLSEHAKSTVIGREGEVCFQVDCARLGEGLAVLLRQRLDKERIGASRIMRPTKRQLRK